MWPDPNIDEQTHAKGTRAIKRRDMLAGIAISATGAGLGAAMMRPTPVVAAQYDFIGYQYMTYTLSDSSPHDTLDYAEQALRDVTSLIGDLTWKRQGLHILGDARSVLVLVTAVPQSNGHTHAMILVSSSSEALQPQVIGAIDTSISSKGRLGTTFQY